MSPELLNPEQFNLDHGRPTKESDCYALGMVIYEVLTGKLPFALLKDHIVTQKVTKGERPERPGGAKGAWFTDELWEMLGLCWAMYAPRPNIDAVGECLERVSGIWEPIPPQADDDEEEDEDDCDFVLTVRIFISIWSSLRVCGNPVLIASDPILHQMLAPTYPYSLRKQEPLSGIEETEGVRE